MPSWTPFEHQIWRNLEQCSLADENNFLVTVSGGLDSVVLLQVLRRIKPSASIEVAHFHHGPSSQIDQREFRDRAFCLVEELARKTNAKFLSFQAPELLKSEDDCRRARWDFINSCRTGGQVLATAHHQDDRLETMLLKLIRGAGPDGLAAFQMWNGDIFRPFLNVSKNDLKAYADTNKLTWIEDPSNSDVQFLRNWLREKWLPLLEERVSGARSSMARSLDILVAAAVESKPFGLEYNEGALSREWYNLLPADQQLRALALYLREGRIFSFTTGQLNEIRKRLDKNQKDITFDLVGKKWVINASQIMLR